MTDEPKPLTDEELDTIEAIVAEAAALKERHPSVTVDLEGSYLYGIKVVGPSVASRLVAEVRRLRSNIAKHHGVDLLDQSERHGDYTLGYRPGCRICEP
jgi:hypothetical protein